MNSRFHLKFAANLSKDWGPPLAAGAVVKNLNTKLVSRLVVPVPPLEFQHRFTAIVESVERQKASQRAHLAELDTLFASVQSRAFRGDL